MTAATDDRPEPGAAARLLWSERYASARVLFCGGSVVRGQGQALSDLDVVVVFDHVECARRESFRFRGWPVEVFAHDPETLAYFVEQDRKRGRPALAQMVVEGIVVPEATAWSTAIQGWARAMLADPERPSLDSLAAERYSLTDLLDDFRDDRSHSELVAIAAGLYPFACNFLLKTQGRWLGASKLLPRLVQSASPNLGPALVQGFERFFASGDRTDAVMAVHRVLESSGGELFEGFCSDAPADFRVPREQVPWLRELPDQD